MRQLMPTPLQEADLSVLEDRADRAIPADRPWVMANMVMSVDGSYAVDGRSGGLGSPGDRRVFHHLRSVADVILVAAGTARTERYRRPHMEGDALERRRAQGLSDDPLLVVVSRSLRLPADLPLLGGPGRTPVVLHPGGADTSAVPDGVELRAAGEGQVDLAAALAELRSEGAALVLCEGGPSLLGALQAHGLLDELFVTLAPQLVGGRTVGLLGHGEADPRPVVLHRLLEEDGALFATYRRG